MGRSGKVLSSPTLLNGQVRVGVEWVELGNHAGALHDGMAPRLCHVTGGAGRSTWVPGGFVMGEGPCPAHARVHVHVRSRSMTRGT